MFVQEKRNAEFRRLPNVFGWLKNNAIRITMQNKFTIQTGKRHEGPKESGVPNHVAVLLQERFGVRD